jgi:serine/threonine-protein kinase mTOR
VVALLPRLASFSPERFASDYLAKCLQHLLSVLKAPTERGSGFLAIADMALSLSKVGCVSGFEACLQPIATEIKAVITFKGKQKPNCQEALQVRLVAQRVQSEGKVGWRPKRLRALLG